MSNKKRNSQLRSYARYTGLAFEMIAIIGGGSFAGYKLDQRFPRDIPLFTLIFSLTSVGIALYLVIRDVLKNSRKNDEDQ